VSLDELFKCEAQSVLTEDPPTHHNAAQTDRASPSLYLSILHLLSCHGFRDASAPVKAVYLLGRTLNFLDDGFDFFHRCFQVLGGIRVGDADMAGAFFPETFSSHSRYSCFLE